MSAVVAGLGEAVPGVMDQDGMWDAFFADHYGRDPLAERIWRRSGVRTRHGAVDPRVEDVRAWGTEARMRRFLEEAAPLGKEAVAASLEQAHLAASDIDLFAVASCTGYATPGLDILLARDLGMRPDVQRLHIGHMGCYAALPGLATVADAATARGMPAVLLCVELTSLHIQPPSDRVDQVVAHALFADAAAAAVVVPGGPGLEVVDVATRTDASNAHMMTWDVTDHGFRMGLSPDVPRVLEEHVAAVVDELLDAHGLLRADVAAWGVHPGGPRIVEAVAGRLGLADDQVAESRGVLRDYGNCSSATILLILRRLLETRRPADGDHVVAMAFGPGLTLVVALLRYRAAAV